MRPSARAAPTDPGRAERRRPRAEATALASGHMGENALPEPDAAREWLGTMMLIRRFEERAGEMYAKAKNGGFLHSPIREGGPSLRSPRAVRDRAHLHPT